MFIIFSFLKNACKLRETKLVKTPALFCLEKQNIYEHLSKISWVVFRNLSSTHRANHEFVK